MIKAGGDNMIYDYDYYKTTTIRVNKSDLDIIKAMAKEQHRSNNYIINQAIIKYITSNNNANKDDMYD